MIEHPIFARICRSGDQISKAWESLGNLHLDGDDLPVEIIVQRWKPKRTDQQNRYLWGVVYAMIAQETGNDVNELHDYFLGEFFGWEEREVLGRKKLRPRERSSKQVKARFSEFLESVISKAATLGIVIPPPNHDLPDSLKGE